MGKAIDNADIIGYIWIYKDITRGNSAAVNKEGKNMGKYSNLWFLATRYNNDGVCQNTFRKRMKDEFLKKGIPKISISFYKSNNHSGGWYKATVYQILEDV